MPTLVVEATKQKIAIDQPAVTIGSGDKSTIQIEDGAIAPIHCQLIKTQQGYKLVALEMQKGTYVNGIKVKEQVLKRGDVIQLGSTTFVWQDDGAARPTTQAVKPPTSKLPAAKPPTTAIPAPKPATQAVKSPTARIPAQPAKQPTQAVKKTPTSSIPAQPAKPPTAAVKTPTSRVPTQQVKSPTRRVPTQRQQKINPYTKKPVSRRSALAELKVDMHRKKLNPLIPIGVLGVVAVGAIGYFLFQPSTEELMKEVDQKVNALRAEARELEEKYEFEKAIEKYKELIKYIQGAGEEASKRWGHEVLAVEKSTIPQLQQSIKALKKEEGDLQKFISRWESLKDSEDVDRLRTFRNQNETLVKYARHPVKGPEAKAAFKQLEERIFVLDKKQLTWEKVTQQVREFREQKQWKKAAELVRRFLGDAKDETAKKQAQETLDNVLVPAARDNIKSLKSEVRRKKEENAEEAQKLWTREVEERFKGVLPDEELDRHRKECLGE